MEFDDLVKDIENAKVVDLKEIPFMEVNEEWLKATGSLFEQYFRQTGRTTRMLKCIAEDIRRAELEGKEKLFLLVGHNSVHAMDLLQQLRRMLTDKGFEFQYLERDRIRFTKCRVFTRSIEYIKWRGDPQGIQGTVDEVYIDPSCLDHHYNEIIRKVTGR